MTGPAGQVGHYYTVLGVPEGASFQVVQAAYEAIERSCALLIELPGEQGEQARMELAAAQHAYRQIQALKVKGTLVHVPDLPAADKARAGCMIPLLGAVLLGAFIWWPRPTLVPNPASSAPVSEAEVIDVDATAPTAADGSNELGATAVPAAEDPTGPPTTSGDIPLYTPSTNSEPWSTSTTEADLEPTDETSVSATAPEATASDLTGIEPATVAEEGDQTSAIVPSTPAPVSIPPRPSEALTRASDSDSPGDSSESSVSEPPPTTAPRGTFTIGSFEAQVKAVMGRPSTQYGNTWIYGVDTVEFENGRVKTYSNASGNLKISITPKTQSSKTTFSIGDSQDVVLSVMGTPSTQYGDTWIYGVDTVEFENGRVKTYSNASGNLKISITPKTRSSKTTFSIGDSQDVVLSVMGTPSTQYGDTWIYGVDTIEFENGRVSTYSNISGNLPIR